MKPFSEAMEFIKAHPGAGSANGLSKLILSIYNPKHSFSIAECLSSFDRDRLALAIDMINHYGSIGEDEDLLKAGKEICETRPDLMELSNAASDAKEIVRQKWRREEEAKWALEDAEENKKN